VTEPWNYYQSLKAMKKRQNTNDQKRRRGDALRRQINRIEDLDPEREAAWIKLLRQYHRPVCRLRVCDESTNVVKFGNEDLWQVGQELLPTSAAIKLAKNYLIREKKPLWGLPVERESDIEKQLMKE